MDRRALGLLFLLAGMAAIAAVTMGGSPEPTRVALPSQAGERLVSLSPPITETLYAIGAQSYMVGRSAYCAMPVAALSLPPAGTGLKPDFEQLVRLNPSTILTESTQAGPVDELRRIADVDVLPWLTADDMIASTKRLGLLTGHPDEANALADELDALLSREPGARAPSVLVALGADDVSNGSIWYVRPDSMHGQAIGAAGLRNAIELKPTGFPMLSVEALLDLDPTAILVMSNEEDLTTEGRERIIASFDSLHALSAVETHRIGVVSGPGTFSTGPGIRLFVANLRAEAERIGLAPQ